MRKLKGFTLVEVIVVIAIFGILMAGLMNFWRPIRETYVDSTLYETQRTSQDGISEFLCEMTRYAEKMVIYDQGAQAPGASGSGSSNSSVSDVQHALNAFYHAYSLPDKEKPNVHVIVINRKEYYSPEGTITGSSDPNGFRGRLITNAFDSHNPFNNAESEKGLRTLSGYATGQTYMALGGPYYGRSDYLIYLDTSGLTASTVNSSCKAFKYSGENNGLRFVVESSLRNSGGVVKNGSKVGDTSVVVDNDSVTCITKQGNLTKNMDEILYYVQSNGYAAGSRSDTGNTINNATANTYIVYMIPDDGDR